MSEVWTIGEMLVEIMRKSVDVPLDIPAEFVGPFPSGAPAIFIDTVARLGHSAGIIGGVGDDSFGKCLLSRLQLDGVRTDFVNVVPGRSTACAFVAYASDGSRRFVFHIEGTPAVRSTIDRAEAIENPRFFHIMGCSLMINEVFRKVIIDTLELFHRKGALVSFDPNIRNELLGSRSLLDVVGPVMRLCRVLMAGVQELLALNEGRTVADSVASLFSQHQQLEVIVVKRGKDGCTIFTRDNVMSVQAFPVQEVDPTGAGDSFDAGFLCGMLENRPLVECGKMAAAAGALNAAAFGPMEGKISPEAVREMIG